MKARTYTNAFLTIVALAFALVLSACGDPSPRLIDTNFPEKTNTRVELKPAESNETIRYVYLAPDKHSKTLTQIEYNDGVTTYVFHDKAGKDTEIRSFYKSADGSDQRVMRYLVILEADGRSYKSHQFFREDGSLARQGGRLADGSYQTLYFVAGTGAIEKRLIFNKTQDLQSEEAYSTDGKLVEKTVKISSYELSTTRYSADGKIVSVINDSSYGSRRGKFYYEDGTTVKMSFSHSGWSVDVYYYDRAGVLTLEVEYVSSGMTVTAYAPGEKAQYKQYWKPLSGTNFCDASFALEKVEEYWKWGNYRYSRETKHTVVMAPDGKTILKVVNQPQSWSNARTETTFHPDGSVAVETQYDNANQPARTTSFKPGERKLTLKKEMFEKPQFDCLDLPPTKMKKREEQVYYDTF